MHFNLNALEFKDNNLCLGDESYEEILLKVTGRNKLLKASSKLVLDSSKISLGGQSK